MGDTYIRQSTYTDGDVITAAHTNNEFNQLLAAFAASSGHTHDGTTAEGGPISVLLSNTLSFGTGADTDIAVTFNANTNDGLLTWKEDEDYFEFNDDILIATTEKLQFRDTAIYIHSSADGQLDLVADTEIQIAATTIDMNGAVDISGNLGVGGNLVVTGTTTFNGGTITMGDAATDNVVFGANIDSAIIPDDDNTFDLGSSSQQWRDIYINGSAYIDGLAEDVLVATDKKVLFRDSALFINSSADGQLDIVADTEIQIAATTIDINGAVDVSGNLSVGGNLDVTGSFDMSDANITNIGSIALDTITNDGTDITLDSSGDIILDAGGNNIIVKSGGTSILDIANNSTDVELTVSTADKNFAIKGTDGASAITALDIDMALAGKATFSGDVVVTGDLTISGDDLVMGTNTAGALLIADGTNFNPTVITDLAEIATAASGDILLAIDASGGGLKKIERSTLVAGLATDSAISNVSEDSTPQLGGNLDMNGADIVTTSNATLDLAPNGTGTVVVRGNTNSGAIVFNCESNSHGQKVFGQPHSASVTNTLMLPAGANSTLVSLVSADTLTNKTLTAPTLTGTATVASLDISGDIDVDGTTNLDVVDIDGAVSIAAATTIATNNKIIFRDAAIHISSTADGDLSIAADDEIDLTSTLIDINGNVEISGTATTTGVHTFTAVPVFPNNTVETADIQADAITGAKIADDAIDSEHYTDGSIDTAHVAADAITEAKIADNAVESEHVNDNVISGQTALTSGIADADELLISDNGTIKRTDMSVIKTYIGAADDATALAIALG